MSNLARRKKIQIAFQKEVIVLFAGAMLILAGIGFVLYPTLERQKDTNKWVSHTYEVINQTQLLLLHMTNLESTLRGYFIAKNPDALAHYAQNKPLVWADLKALRKLTSDNPLQQKNLQTIETLIRSRLSQLEALSRTAPHSLQIAKNDPFLKLFATGLETRELLRKEINLAVSTEQKLLEKRQQESQENSSQTRWLLNLSLATVVLLLGSCIYLVNREGVGRKAAEANLYESNEELEKQVHLLQIEIAERQRAEEQIAQLNQTLEGQVETLNSTNHNLEAVNKELEAFSYSVSHDLRSPLRSIDGFSQALLDFYKEQLDEDAQDYLNRIRANTQRMAQLIDDMLQLSRLTRGELRIGTVNLSKIAEDMKQELDQQEPARKVNFSIEPDLVVTGDKQLLHALLQNLIANAWKFTSQHETGNITFGSYIDDSRPINLQRVYFVKDDGAGFEMEFVHKLFGAFQRLHAMHEFSGTGIGLATVQRIVHRHGGEVWAEGEVEKGAKFFFTINESLTASNTPTTDAPVTV